MIPCNLQEVGMIELWAKQTDLRKQWNLKGSFPAEMTRFYFGNNTVETRNYTCYTVEHSFSTWP